MDFLFKTYTIFLLSQSFLFSAFDARDFVGGAGANTLISDGGADYGKPEIVTNSLGHWKIDNPNAGVAAMQLQLMPNDKVVWFDATTLGPSAIKLEPPGNCPPNPDTNNAPDCFAHAIAYDWKTTKVRTIVVC